MNINHRRCGAWLINRDDPLNPYVETSCGWPRGHDDPRHWSVKDGVVRRWETAAHRPWTPSTGDANLTRESRPWENEGGHP